jgi:uncharacterized protein
MPTVDELVALAREVLEQAAEVELAVLFGSWARGEAHQASDFDLGVLWRGTPPTLAAELALQARLEEALGRDVDVVDIAAATPALRWRIVRDGVLIAAVDPAGWSRLRIGIAIEHDDLRYTQQRALERQRRRLMAAAVSPARDDAD